MLSRRIYWDIPRTLALVFFSILIIDKIISGGIKSSSYVSLDLARPTWPRGGMVTQRIANPCIPVRFWAWPPRIQLFYFFKKSMLIFLFLGSSVGRAVDC